MKKIALYLPGIGTGGIESCTINQFLYMDKRLVNVEFLVDAPPDRNFNLERIERNNGIVRTCFGSSNSSSIRKILRPLAFVKAVRKYDYDVIHLRISHPTSLMYAFACKLFTKSKVVATSESQGAAGMSFGSKILCTMCRILFPIYCDVRFADSIAAGKWMYGKHSFKVMADGFDTTSMKYSRSKRVEIRKQLKISEDEILIGHIGRFAREKNHVFIIDVFEEFLKTHENGRLLLIGKGQLQNQIIELCHKKRIKNKCIFIESVDKLEPYYSAFDIFIFPSLCEGFGMVAAEAQAACLPVLASNAVPSETKLTENIIFEDLNSPISIWVKDLEGLLEKNKDRDDVDLRNLYSKCDIRNISNELINIYNNL